MKPKNVVQTFTLLIVLSAFPIFRLHADLITMERSITWVQAGDKWDPSQMTLVRTEFDGGISYGSKEYIGPQTAEALMNTFDAAYNRKHAQTSLTVFPRTSIAKIKQSEVTGLPAWSKLLSKEGISTQFTITEIDARYPRKAWLQLFLERGATVESLMDYFFCMAHRYQLAFLEDNPHFWETGAYGASSTDAWETYKANYIDRFVSRYTRNWKTAAETARKGIETTKNSIPKAPNVPISPQISHLHSEPEKITHSPLQNLVNQLEQTVKDLERQNRWDAAKQVKEVLEHVKKALAHDKTSRSPSNELRSKKKKSGYPPL